MQQSLIVISRRPLVAGLLLFVALAAMAGVERAGAASGQEPRIVAVEGFAFEPNHDEGLRVAALVLSRYPDVQARDYPKPLRKHLRFRAHARLDVFDGAERIARGREAESLPLTAKRHSLRFVHLLLFSRAESEAILAAGDPQAGPAPALRSDDNDETVDTSALSALKVIANGKTLERSTAEETAPVALADQAPPRIVNGCVIVPGTRCHGVNLRGADLRNADLTGAVLLEVDLRDADLTGANLTGSRLMDARLTGANLSGANLRGTSLENANLSDARASGANLSGASGGANLSGADLSGADLSRSSLVTADLSRANLSGANLSGANFHWAQFSHANLTGANLTGSNLATTQFSHADLTRADLTRADLTRADLTGADLTGADLTGAELGRAKFCNTTRPWGTVDNRDC